MRFESSATAVTWLPFEALDRIAAVPLELAVAHHDEPPGELLPDLAELRSRDAIREANELRGWIEVVEGRIVDYGQAGDGFVGPALELADRQVSFAAVEFPAILPEPEVGDGWVRFVQTVGGRIGLPAPRPIAEKPYLHVGALSAWTTVELVLRADGTSDARIAAASPFPRHSLYDAERRRVGEAGAAELSFGELSPWGDERTPAFAEAVASELERRLATALLDEGAKLVRRRVARGETLVDQGHHGDDLYVVLDGVLDVEIDGRPVAQVGSGAVLGERAILGDGRRTATLRAVRASRVAVIPGDRIPRPELEELSATRLR
jgi:hypothetical protein